MFSFKIWGMMNFANCRDYELFHIQNVRLKLKTSAYIWIWNKKIIIDMVKMNFCLIQFFFMIQKMLYFNMKNSKINSNTKFTVFHIIETMRIEMKIRQMESFIIITGFSKTPETFLIFSSLFIFQFNLKLKQIFELVKWVN